MQNLITVVTFIYTFQCYVAFVYLTLDWRSEDLDSTHGCSSNSCMDLGKSWP